MELEVTLLERVRNWEGLSRWEQSELGRDLRRSGLSYGEIMERIPAKKSTLASWCRDVKLTEEQFEAIRARRAPEPGYRRNTNWKRRQEVAEIRQAARRQVPELISEPLWLAGLVLYWAEGSKTKGHVAMANTDPRALRLFIQWVCEYLDPAGFSLHLHLHEGNDEPAARSYWQKETGFSTPTSTRLSSNPRGQGTGRTISNMAYAR